MKRRQRPVGAGLQVLRRALGRLAPAERNFAPASPFPPDPYSFPVAFPRNDYQPPSGLALIPPVVKNLLILNGLVFIAQLVFRARAGVMDSGVGPIEQWFALWPAGIPSNVELPTFGGRFMPWQLATTAFLHADFQHILFNMFGIWMFGAPLEKTLGSQRFAFFFGACVLGASLLQLGVISWPFLGDALPANAYGPTVGASGGLLGILGAAAMLFPDARVALLFFPVPIKLKWMVLGLVALDLLGGFGAYASNTAHFAHLGGMVTGLLLILYWRGRLPIKPAARSI